MTILDYIVKLCFKIKTERQQGWMEGREGDKTSNFLLLIPHSVNVETYPSITHNEKPFGVFNNF